MPPPYIQHHRKSIRIKGYDYSQPGGYFITITTYNHQYLFGELSKNVVTLNKFGEVAWECWNEIPTHFSNISLDAFIVMPNHIHGVLIIEDRRYGNTACNNEAHQEVLPYSYDVFKEERFGKPVSGSIPTVVRSYKSVVTKKINLIERTPKGIVWQRNYYEHILRNNEDLNRIRNYILANPENWLTDQENMDYNY